MHNTTNFQSNFDDPKLKTYRTTYNLEKIGFIIN